MKSLEEIKMILKKHKSVIEKRFKVKEIGIFGSYVRGEQKNISDIDILVEFYEPVGFFAFLDLEEYLTGLFNTKVDLVSKKALKPRIGKYILQEMISV
ncbi:MAG: nucleotidyltransferase family protein [bacterium]